VPNYLVIRVQEIPAVGQVVSGVMTVENVTASGDPAADQRLAGQQGLQRMRDQAPSGVIGVVLASDVTRRTYTTPQPSPTVT
jgi:hypothetical protein